MSSYHLGGLFVGGHSYSFLAISFLHLVQICLPLYSCSPSCCCKTYSDFQIFSGQWCPPHCKSPQHPGEKFQACSSAQSAKQCGRAHPLFSQSLLTSYPDNSLLSFVLYLPFLRFPYLLFQILPRLPARRLFDLSRRYFTRKSILCQLVNLPKIPSKNIYSYQSPHVPCGISNDTFPEDVSG